MRRKYFHKFSKFYFVLLNNTNVQGMNVRHSFCIDRKVTSNVADLW